MEILSFLGAKGDKQPTTEKLTTEKKKWGEENPPSRKFTNKTHKELPKKARGGAGKIKSRTAGEKKKRGATFRDHDVCP